MDQASAAARARIERLVDQDEAVRWLEREEVTFEWIVEEYQRKYGVVTTGSYWGMVKRDLGIPDRESDWSELIPWELQDLVDQFSEQAIFLRKEMMVRRGAKLDFGSLAALTKWKDRLAAAREVVHYNPDAVLDERWSYLPQRAGIDTDLIRVPDDRVADET